MSSKFHLLKLSTRADSSPTGLFLPRPQIQRPVTSSRPRQPPLGGHPDTSLVLEKLPDHSRHEHAPTAMRHISSRATVAGEDLGTI